jgi:hypothetical protein
MYNFNTTLHKGGQNFLIFILLLVIHSPFAQSRELDKTISLENTERQYMIHLSPSFNSGGKFPLIIALHRAKKLF